MYAFQAYRQTNEEKKKGKIIQSPRNVCSMEGRVWFNREEHYMLFGGKFVVSHLLISFFPRFIFPFVFSDNGKTMDYYR